MKDVIQSKLTEQIRTKFDQGLQLIEEALADSLSALSEEERSHYGSINEQNKLLVNKVREYSQHSPALSSPEVDWTEFESDYQARFFLESRATQLASLIYRMQSTKILHDYDNYHDSLTDYGYAQYKKGAGAPGFAEKVADLKQFFPRSTGKKPTGNE